MMNEVILECRNLIKTFDGIRAVDGVSLTVAPQQIVAIIGPNGAGKTTLFNLITGFLTPDAGSIYFKGRNITKLPPDKIARLGLARTFQDLRLIHRLTVLENVLLARPNPLGETWYGAIFSRWQKSELKEREIAMQWLQFVGLASQANELAGALSYGQQKLLTLACCLAFGADLLLLDEPVSGVAPATIEQLVDYIRQLPKMGKTVVFIEHNLEVVKQLADWVVVMDEGKVISEGKWDVVSQDAKVLEAYLA
jgi:ABC-type branched-subunit amino acid transport system ATPase component